MWQEQSEKMEKDTCDSTKEDRIKDNGKNDQSNPVADVEEIIKEAGLEEEEDPSDVEYLSAEEDTDSGTDFCHAEQSTFDKSDRIDIPADFPPPRNSEEKTSSGDEANEEKEKIEEKLKQEKLAARKKEEESLTAEEREERKDKAQNIKADGNTKFRNGDYDEAIEAYSEALEICPLNFHKEMAIMFANRAACKMKKEEYEEAIVDSTQAIELHPHYLKAVLRRAELYEKVEKLDDALKDYEKTVQLDPSQHAARAACLRLAEEIRVRNEKMKDEMMGKLKDLGNLVLRPFGLNVNNFNLQQDPNTGSYSVQFSQNPPGNGT